MKQYLLFAAILGLSGQLLSQTAAGQDNNNYWCFVRIGNGPAYASSLVTAPANINKVILGADFVRFVKEKYQIAGNGTATCSTTGADRATAQAVKVEQEAKYLHAMGEKKMIEVEWKPTTMPPPSGPTH